MADVFKGVFGLFAATTLIVSLAGTARACDDPLGPSDEKDPASDAPDEWPAWPGLPAVETAPERTGPLYIYFEGPWMAANDHLWGLMNTRFQIRADTRLDVSGTNVWAVNNFPGDNPADSTVFRPYIGPTGLGKQVVARIKNAYAAANYWPSNKPKLHSFQLIGPNAQDSPCATPTTRTITPPTAVRSTPGTWVVHPSTTSARRTKTSSSQLT
ncbi:MAG: hypothetical protein QM783_07245 [Phycisphaerales bacterium]